MRVIIIDDDPIVVESLKMIVEANGIEVVALGHSASEALKLSRENSFDILMMDIRMGDMTGIKAAIEILKDKKDAKILLITTFKDDEYIEEAIRIGCKGYILKQNIKTIIPALQAVNSGQMVLDKEIVSKISELTFNTAKKEINSPLNLSQLEAFNMLSEREIEILKAIGEGLNNKEIASKLFLSEGTVRNYISEMLLKLNLRDRTQLAIYYLNNK